MIDPLVGFAPGFAGVAGSLFVHVVGFVSPEVFGLHMVILAFTMLYVGGIGTIIAANLAIEHYGAVPVGVGQPSLLIDELTVGGTQA